MIKGLISLFTSGIIFTPMVLLGVISGAYAVINMSPEDIRSLMSNPLFYAGVFGVAAVYTFVFAKIYTEGGISIDWTSTGLRVIWNFVRYLMAFVLTMSFVVMISIF